MYRVELCHALPTLVSSKEKLIAPLQFHTNIMRTNLVVKGFLETSGLIPLNMPTTSFTVIVPKVLKYE